MLENRGFTFLRTSFVGSIAHSATVSIHGLSSVCHQRKLNCVQKKLVTKSTVWNIALCAEETWTLTEVSKKTVGCI